MKEKVLIIGGVAGGASAASRLRRLNEEAEIVIFERGKDISYANCGMPYYIGGVIQDETLLNIQTPSTMKARLNIDVRVNSEVINIDTQNKIITIKSEDKIYDESYTKLVISTGAEPKIPKGLNIDIEGIFTLRSLFDMYKINNYIKNNMPKSAVVIGGGFVGIEMVENLAGLDVDVTIIEAGSQILGVLDREMAVEVQNYIENKGIKLYLNSVVQNISEVYKLDDKITFNNEDMTKESYKFAVNVGNEIIYTDMVFISAGVVPESKLAKSAGIECDSMGCIVVDNKLKTSDNNIYAVGDVVAGTNRITGTRMYSPLAGPANKQGRMVADIICGSSKTYNGSQNSAITKIFNMNVAVTGLNENTIKNEGIDYDSIHFMAASHSLYYPNAEMLSFKVLFSTTNGQILGAQILGGSNVDKYCDIFAMAIHSKLCAEELEELDLCYAPPFASSKSPANIAGFMIDNILTGKIKQIQWSEYPNISEEEGIILDVRNNEETAVEKLVNSTAIPLHELRERFGELDINKKIYIHCQSGLRSYIACRLLKQKGFDCYNISGGYRWYKIMKVQELL